MQKASRFAVFRRAWWLVLPLILGIGACQNMRKRPDPPNRSIGFAEVKPILEERCLPCHQGNYLGAPLLDMRTPGVLYDPDRTPRLVVPGNPEESYLLMKVHLHEDTAGTMPPLGHGLTAEEKELLGEWIRRGADWPEGETLTSAAIRQSEN